MLHIVLLNADWFLHLNSAPAIASLCNDSTSGKRGQRSFNCYLNHLKLIYC